jgi:hypothetical protein
MAIMAPLAVPLKLLFRRGNAAGSRGPCPLGAAMDSSALELSHRAKYCHNGGLAFAHQHGSGWLGVQEGDYGPFRRSPETRGLQGKMAQSPGSVPFGDRHGLVCRMDSSP